MSALLAEVLAWCDARPRIWPLPAPEAEQAPFSFRREDDGTVSVQGELPDLLVMTVEFLNAASSDYVTFADGVLTMTVNPSPVSYQLLGPDRYGLTVMFERVRKV